MKQFSFSSEDAIYALEDADAYVVSYPTSGTKDLSVLYFGFAMKYNLSITVEMKPKTRTAFVQLNFNPTGWDMVRGGPIPWRAARGSVDTVVVAKAEEYTFHVTLNGFSTMLGGYAERKVAHVVDGIVFYGEKDGSIQSGITPLKVTLFKGADAEQNAKEYASNLV